MTPRCFVDPGQWESDRIRLSAGDSRHIATVLRCVEGDAVTVCDGKGGEASCRISGTGNGRIEVDVIGRTRRSADVVLVTLVQAIPKSQKMEWIIQKATELGVWAVVPVMTDRGVVRLEGDRAGHRVERWRKIAEEAAKQCRTAWVPTISPIVPLKTLLESGVGVDLTLIGSLEGAAAPLRSYLRSLEGKRPSSVALMIGPEGDFSPEEMEMAKGRGAVPVSYGSRVLRVETAALYGLSILAYEFPAD